MPREALKSSFRVTSIVSISDICITTIVEIMPPNDTHDIERSKSDRRDHNIPRSTLYVWA